MTESDNPVPEIEELEKVPVAKRPFKSRLRRFFLMHLPLTIAGGIVLAAAVAVALYIYASSSSFENIVRKRMAASIQTLTGGSVEISSFHWDLLHLEADVNGLVIHGLESAGEAPYLRIEHMHVGLSIVGALSPHLISRTILLRDLEIQQPSMHLIVYRNGTTNQPHPARPSTNGKPALDRLFDLKAGHIAIERGIFHYDNRAAAFDFQNRFIPLDLEARDAALHTSYLAATGSTPESYRIETAASDLNLVRGGKPSRPGAKNAIPPVHGRMKATIDLQRSALVLRNFEVAAQSAEGKEHTLTIAGALHDFTHLRWQATTRGDLDMRLLDPLTGYPFAPEGIAHLDLNSAGDEAEFRIDGIVHMDGGSYIGPGVVARNIALDAQIHADPQQLVITQVIARFKEGGQMEGSVSLDHWLNKVVDQAVIEPATPRPAHTPFWKKKAPPPPPVAQVHPPDTTIPVDGKVTAKIENVSLDTILDIVSLEPFKRIGIDTLLNGTANANWVKGDQNTLVVTAMLGMSPLARSVANEAPASGVLDATYYQHDGSVEVRSLDLHLPQSHLDARGTLGAYPLTSPSSLAVDFHTRNLSEFDTVLRGLGLKRGARLGAAALPVGLQGQTDFHGTWTGSLMRPRIAGELKATQLEIELPAQSPADAVRPQFLTLDSVEATGSYSLSRIAIDHAVLVRGPAKVNVAGTLDAAPAAPASPGHPATLPEFDGASEIHAHVEAAKVGVDSLQLFLKEKLPVTGSLDAQFQAIGPLASAGGSGWIELQNGSIYGEPVPRVRVQGAMTNAVLNLTSVSGSAEGGSISGTGSYDLKAKHFQLSAKGNGIQISRIGWLQKNQTSATGKLGFSISGSGTLADPRIQGHAEVGSLVLAGQPMGVLEADAHTVGHTLEYDLTTHLEDAQLKLHGTTQLDADNNTNDQLEFSNFDIGTLMRLAHIDSVKGESALAGTISFRGPLAHTEQLRGESHIQQLAVTVAGVHLESKAGAHATLANNQIHLDSLHVTGDNTDLRAEATLDLNNGKRLDLVTSGSINLKLAETLDPDLTASGTTTFQVEAHGPLRNPGLSGQIQLDNGSLSLEDLPNGLSQMHGTFEFNQNRLEIRTLTAMTGGGVLSVGGSLAYQHGIYADLSVTGQQVRIRYPVGITSLADAKLHLQGTQSSLLLSGDVLITRFNASPDLDLAALASTANASAQAVAPPNAPSNHVRLDVHLVSSPQLNFQNAFAKLAGFVDLRVRGTLAAPSLLGRVSVTDGSAIIAGTRYDLQRGEITFTNPVRIEPALDLTATAHVEDYDITLGLHGPPEKLVVTYRSDPPLPEADVVALLALGHTEDQQRLYTQQQEQQLANPTTDSLLGGALNATVSSRVQKLFGAGSVKVDPNYLGAFGNSTSRVTVEEQLGRNLTLTYATDVNTTGQQLLQAEVAINRHISLVVARDESGVFSMVIKATRRMK